MLFSALGSLSSRLDSRFMTAYFFPAFAAVLGTIWILVLSVGNQRFTDRVEGLDSAEQAVATEAEATPLLDRIDQETYRRILADAGAALRPFTVDGGRVELPIRGHLITAATG